MINDIARQFQHLPTEDAVAAIAGHVQRFWDPRMRRRLIALADGQTAALDPLAVAAVELVR